MQFMVVLEGLVHPFGAAWAPFWSHLRASCSVLERPCATKTIFDRIYEDFGGQTGGHLGYEIDLNTSEIACKNFIAFGIDV